MDVRAVRDPSEWHEAARLLFAYQRETALELGHDPPADPDGVWRPVRHEVVAPASVFTTYLIAYEGTQALGGVAVVAHDAVSVVLKRGYVRPEHRRRGVARALVAAAAAEATQRGVSRVALDVLGSREAAVAAWRRLGFVECEPWGDAAMRYLERRHRQGASPWLGLHRGAVALTAHDRRWSSVYRHHAEVVAAALAGRAAGIEHIGSTAVEDLVAKPVVDVAVRLAPGADEPEVVASLEAKRYVFRGDKRDSGGLLFVAEDEPGRRIAHVHVLRHGDPQWERYLRVRDLLRTDRRARGSYSALKRDLAGRFPGDRAAYTAGKRTFVEELLRSSTAS